MVIGSRSLNIHTNEKAVYFTFPSFDKYEFVIHAFSTRMGGVSKGIYESMNLCFGNKDEKENVLQNYKILCGKLGIDYKKLVFSDQTHGTGIKHADEKDKGKGIVKEKDYQGIDGLITDRPEVPLVTLFADCVPLFFLDPVKKVVGLAHAGWKGTVGKIGEKMVREFINVYGSKEENILAGIAPSIGPCCFEVEADVQSRFSKMKPSVNHLIKEAGKNKYIIDLWQVNKEILIQAGLLSKNISVTDLCTKCNKHIMFSHRGHNGKRGSMGAVIQLK